MSVAFVSRPQTFRPLFQAAETEKAMPIIIEKSGDLECIKTFHVHPMTEASKY